jgi:hypothetical protein
LKRGALIFASALVVPFIVGYALTLITLVTGVDAWIRFDYQLAPVRVSPRRNATNPACTLNRSHARTLPGPLAPLDAVAQWVAVMLLVGWLTRRSSPSTQLAASFVAILVVGTIFLVVMHFFGAEPAHMDL